MVQRVKSVGPVRALSAAGVAATMLLSFAPNVLAQMSSDGSIPSAGSAKFTVRDSGGKEETGVLEGVVFDPDQEAVAEARITIIDEATGDEWRPNCDRVGRFQVDSLEPGSYTLKIATSGLHSFLRTGIAVQAHRAVHFDVTLREGEMGDDDSAEPSSNGSHHDEASGTSKKDSKHKSVLT